MPGKGRKAAVGAPEPRYRGCSAAIGSASSRLFGPKQPSPAYFPFTIGRKNLICFPPEGRKRNWSILATSVVPAYIATSNQGNDRTVSQLQSRAGGGQYGSLGRHGEGYPRVLGPMLEAMKDRLSLWRCTGLCEAGSPLRRETCLAVFPRRELVVRGVQGFVRPPALVFWISPGERAARAVLTLPVGELLGS